MGTLSFKKSCRDCNRSNGITSILMDYENDLEFYKNLSDYEASLSINRALSRNGIKCEFCDAFNFDISTVNFDDHEIFKLNDLKLNAKKNDSFFYVYNMIKQENIVDASVDDFYNDFDDFNDFEIRCREKIQDIINMIPITNLVHHPNGIFYVCFTGNSNQIQIEKFRYSGFTKEALINITNNIGKNPFLD